MSRIVYFVRKKRLFVQYSAMYSFFNKWWLIYEISRKLGAGEKFCKIGVLVFFSMPIAFGEALTTQNDNLSGMFLLSFRLYLMDFMDINKRIENNKETYRKVWIMSTCIGRGYLTKPNVCIGMAVYKRTYFVRYYYCVLTDNGIIFVSSEAGDARG